MKTCFIVNPVAGKGRALKAMEELAQKLTALGDTVKRFTTDRVGHATELAKAAAEEGFELVVAVGGDGTVCEVAHGLVHTDAVMGIVPSGTGNDYCRALGMHRKKTNVLHMLKNGKVRTVDCMQVNEFIGLNISTVGFDSEVVKNAPRYSWAGGFSYLLSVLYTIRRYQSPVMRVSMDGKEVFTGSRLLVAAGNGTHYGGGMKVLPASLPDDGEMDYCVIDRAILPRDYVGLLPKVMKGKHKPTDRVHLGRLKHIVIESDEPMTLNLDGNLYEGRHKVEMSILPKALKILVP